MQSSFVDEITLLRNRGWNITATCLLLNCKFLQKDGEIPLLRSCISEENCLHQKKHKILLSLISVTTEDII